MNPDQFKGAAVVGLCGLILFGIGVLWLRTDTREENGVEILGEATVAVIRVEVAGAVVRPGVYELANNSRVDEALIEAGGTTGEADAEWVEKNVNRAAKLVDGQKIYIPRRNEANVQVSGGGLQNFRININSASITELDTLPGIGPATANKMVGGRPYSRIEELVERKMVSQKVFEAISDKIAVW